MARGSAARRLPVVAGPPRRAIVPAIVPAIVLCALGVFAATGCSSSSSRGDAPSARPTTSATLQIVSPAPNERTGTTVDVRLRLDDARVVPSTQVGGKIRPDQGHIHLLLDGQLVAMPSRLIDRLPRLTPGSHTVQAEFVATDHLPFANRVVAAVTFRAR
jgi:hypothetical protein